MSSPQLLSRQVLALCSRGLPWRGAGARRMYRPHPSLIDAASWVICLWAGQSVRCACSCSDGVASEALSVIRDQLARCGPEHLHRTPGWYAVVSHVLSFFLGACFVLILGLDALIRGTWKWSPAVVPLSPSKGGLSPSNDPRVRGKGQIIRQ